MKSSPSEVERQVWDALRAIRFPGMSRDIVSFGFVQRVAVDEAGATQVELAMQTSKEEAAERVRGEVEQVVAALPGVSLATVRMAVTAAPARPAATREVANNPKLVPEVRHLVAVASGKGGVGKSTVAANLAVRLAQLGHRVGLVDADIYGPSIPMLFGLHERPRVEGTRVIPFERHGVKLMSLGSILDSDTPVIWRGPMVMKAIEQLLGDVEWGALDFLIVDLPPGTGDAQLTITQKVSLAGAVIVSTPQDVALIDARKGLAMFRKVNVPVLGMVENMSTFVCPHCGTETDIFKRGGGERVARLLDVPFLGRIPLDAAIVEGGDAGVPIVVAEPDGIHAEVFRQIALAVVAEVERAAAARPQLQIV